MISKSVAFSFFTWTLIPCKIQNVGRSYSYSQGDQNYLHEVQSYYVVRV